MLRQVTEPVWWVTASSPKFSHLVKSNTRLKKTLGWQKPTSIHPPEPVWTCRALCDDLRLPLYTPPWTYSSYPSDNSLKTLPLYANWTGSNLFQRFDSQTQVWLHDTETEKLSEHNPGVMTTICQQITQQNSLNQSNTKAYFSPLFCHSSTFDSFLMSVALRTAFAIVIRFLLFRDRNMWPFQLGEQGYRAKGGESN